MKVNRILFIVIILIIAGTAGFLFLKKNNKTMVTNTPIPTSIPELITTSCDPFPKLPEDFPCEKAVQKALGLYPGTVQKITMVYPRLSNPDGSNTDLGIKKWVVTISLNFPIANNGKESTHALIKISREDGALISTYEY